MKSDNDGAWVVYLLPVHGNPEGVRAVCAQAEWEALQLAQPGQHTLVRAGIPSEGEAERLARGTSGDPKARLPRRS